MTLKFPTRSIAILSLTFFVPFFSPFALGHTAKLTLAEYLKQVREGHEGYKATELISEGLRLRVEEGGLIYAPEAFANVNYLQDSKPTASPSFFGSFTRNDAYSMGISKLMMERLVVSAANYSGEPKIKFGVVRFGNVINSRGSVIPLWIDQIKKGKDVTITDK